MTGIYGWSYGSGGVHHHRLAEPLRVAAARGYDATWGQALTDEIAERYVGGTILVHMLWAPHASQAWEKLAAAGCHRLVLDVDDAMWAPDWAPFAAHYTPEVLAQLYRNVALAHVVTTPSPVIAEHLAQHNANVWVVPNTVPEYLLYRRMRTRPAPTLGYQGSPSHLTDVTDDLRNQLGRFLHAHPDWVMRLWGADPDQQPPGDRIIHTPWAPTVADYYRSVSMDIGIGPLRDTPFNRAKSSLRAIEYAAFGIPAVLSDLEPYKGWVEHGVTGLLVGPGESWYDALTMLAADRDRRERMGRAARDRAAKWTTEANLHRWVEAWESV